jgi:hypothetical protein
MAIVDPDFYSRQEAYQEGYEAGKAEGWKEAEAYYPPISNTQYLADCDQAKHEQELAAKTPTVEQIAKEMHKGLDDAFGRHETGWSQEQWETIPQDWRNKYRTVASAILALWETK